MRLSRSASISAASSTTGPRPTLMSQAVGFIVAIRCAIEQVMSVCGLSGQVTTTKSLVRDQRVERRRLGLRRQAVQAPLVAEHAHAEALARDARHAPADLADADQAERHAGDLVRRRRRARAPCPRSSFSSELSDGESRCAPASASPSRSTRPPTGRCRRGCSTPSRRARWQRRAAPGRCRCRGSSTARTRGAASKMSSGSLLRVMMPSQSAARRRIVAGALSGARTTSALRASSASPAAAIGSTDQDALHAQSTLSFASATSFASARVLAHQLLERAPGRVGGLGALLHELLAQRRPTAAPRLAAARSRSRIAAGTPAGA